MDAELHLAVELAGQIFDVHAGAAVDLRRVFARQ
jgi:hypothetical protein